LLFGSCPPYTTQESFNTKLTDAIFTMNYEETIKEIDSTLGMVPGFMKDTPKDILLQMWPLFKK
jgi:hypothetical protein